MAELPTKSDVLVLDEHTIKDLEIFTSATGETSLFDFCNRTSTKGGEKVLRRRMASPWSNIQAIRRTQESVSFILTRRQAFSKLPTGYVASRVEKYLHEVLPLVTSSNPLEFGFDAFSLWSNDIRRYHRIVGGVQLACKLIQTLRRLVEQPELATPSGDLVPLLEEMRRLLLRPRLSEVPDQEIGSWFWPVLRIDQVFRLHEQTTVMRLLELSYEIDALLAMADVTDENGFVLPQFSSGAPGVHAEGLVHPLLADAVANPVELAQPRRLLFLTGPNMAGKTTYLRAFATAIYLAHLGMGVPARSFQFVPVQRLFSSISLNDDLRGGISYFRAEAMRIKAVAEALAAGYSVIAIMDEPFKGTNVRDAFDASLAILKRFAAREDCLFLFSSHLIELSEQLSDEDQIDCRYFEAEEGEGRLRFDYRLHQGVSSQRLGMRVLREEGIFDLLDGPTPKQLLRGKGVDNTSKP